MGLSSDFGVVIGSGSKFLQIRSDEIHDALKSTISVCKKHHWEVRTWDKYNGVKVQSSNKLLPGSKQGPASLQGDNNALAALIAFLEEPAQPVPGQPGEYVPIIFVFQNMHLAFERSRESMVAAIQHLLTIKDKDGEDVGKFVVALTPADHSVKLPPEVEPLFKVIEHELPDEDELRGIFDDISINEGAHGESYGSIAPETRRMACKYALGLTRLQAEGVFSACMVQFANRPDYAKLLPEYVWTQKSKILNKEGLVTLYNGKETFDDVVGLQGAKDLFKELLTPDEYDPDNPEVRARGVCLCGPPRTGKSLIAKALGNTLNLPVLMVDVGAWFGGYVGDTERNTRKGFQIIRAHAPCIACIDEVEKVMPSARGGDHAGHETSRRMAGAFMQQLQDIKEPVFWCFTANSVDDLHEAFLADERVDGVVYVHLPGPAQLAAGWKLYLGKYFPKEINGKHFPRYLETDFTRLLADARAAKKQTRSFSAWIEQFVAALLCKSGDERQACLDELKKLGPPLSTLWSAMIDHMIDDSGWTIARIRACCRLARLRKRSLTEMAKTMPRRQKKLEKVIARLEAWAEEEAIDAETGEAYVPAEPPAASNGSSGSKVRRKVRRLKDEE